MQEKVPLIIEKLQQLEADFQTNQGIILTEYDLQCLLFHKLYELFSHNLPTHDPDIKGSPLHAELKFFNENGKLYFRPDITILKPKNYSIIHSIGDFKITDDDRIVYKKIALKKEFSFGGTAIIIELKFCRTKSGITSNINKYMDDIAKIKRIKRIVEARSNGRDKVYGFLVIFSKTNKRSTVFQEFINQNHGEDIFVNYYTGNVEI